MSLDHFQVVKLVRKDYSCEILANYGAALNSYKFREMEFVDGYSSPSEIEEQKYKGVILAPFPNRVARARYRFQERDYALAINREKEGLALHGLLYHEPFEIIYQDEQEVKLSYNYAQLKEGYPFLFALSVTYSLKDDGSLLVASEVENLGEKMPFGLGWHPYFMLDEPIDKIKLEMPPSEILELDNTMIPTGNISTFNSKIKTLNLSEHHFDDCFALVENGDNRFRIIGSSHILEIRGASRKEFPYFQIYTPKNRKSIAIEPMTCAPDAFNNQRGLIILNSKEKRSFSYELRAMNRN